MLQEHNMQLLGRLQMTRMGFGRHMKDIAVFAMVSNGNIVQHVCCLQTTCVYLHKLYSQYVHYVACDFEAEVGNC